MMETSESMTVTNRCSSCFRAVDLLYFGYIAVACKHADFLSLCVRTSEVKVDRCYDRM